VEWQLSSKTAAKKSRGFSDEEKAAMREAVRERTTGTGEGENAVLEKIAKMKEPDRSKAKRIHELVKAVAPELAPRTWYGMPAYSKGDKVILYFQDAAKFKARYATLGFSDKAKLDEGRMWPVVYAIMDLTPAEEAKIVALVKRAVS
jgi:uncharacterized protein YdhG (YjbR/CyaY superfamily)